MVILSNYFYKNKIYSSANLAAKKKKIQTLYDQKDHLHWDRKNKVLKGPIDLTDTN